MPFHQEAPDPLVKCKPEFKQEMLKKEGDDVGILLSHDLNIQNLWTVISSWDNNFLFT